MRTGRSNLAHRMFHHAVLLALIFPHSATAIDSPYPPDGGAAAAQALAIRVLGPQTAAHFVFSVLPQSECEAAARGGCATITTTAGENNDNTANGHKVQIAGTSPVESAAALAYYCRKYLHMQFAWGKSGGNQVVGGVKDVCVAPV